MPGQNNLVSKLSEFQALIKGKTIVEVKAGSNREGGDYLLLKVQDPDTKAEKSLRITVGTIYGDLWFKLLRK